MRKGAHIRESGSLSHTHTFLPIIASYGDELRDPLRSLASCDRGTRFAAMVTGTPSAELMVASHTGNQRTRTDVVVVHSKNGPAQKHTSKKSQLESDQTQHTGQSSQNRKILLTTFSFFWCVGWPRSFQAQARLTTSCHVCAYSLVVRVSVLWIECLRLLDTCQ